MDRRFIDALYHELRLLCVTDDSIQKEAMAGIASHLTNPQGDYPGLLRFLSYYGGSYTLPPVIEHLRSAARTFVFSRVVELGAGFGWLGRGISRAFDTPAVFCDKRQWTLIDVVADIETKNGIKRVLDELREGDLIVMSELIHCLENPRKTLRPFTRWPMLVVEYMPSNSAYLNSYNAQVAKFGCKPVSDIRDVFPDGKVITALADPYKMWLILPL